MPKMVAAECIKLKRNSILGIVILGSFCSVILAVVQLLGAEGTQRGFQELNDGVIWNNVTLFFPALLTLMTEWKAAETVTAGDPTFAGPLTGVQLGLTVYHVCEPEMKAEFEIGRAHV